MRSETHDEQETWEVAKRFAASLMPGDVVCLEGDIGAGKTTFKTLKMREACNENGWAPISMRDDRKTVCGGDVKRTGHFRVSQECDIIHAP